jgi:acetoacetate decarboxylase
MGMSASYTTPQRAPLYEAPPYDYKAYRKLSVFCRVDEAAIRAALPSQFEVRGDVIEVFIMDVPHGGALGAYREGGIVAPISYQGRPGGHVLYEIVTNDDSMAVGREVWGYPKKMGEVEWREGAGSAHATLSRRGTRLVEIDFAETGVDYPKPVLQPRFQTRIIPSVEDAGGVTQIIENTLHGASIASRKTGEAKLTLRGTLSDPFADLAVREIVGAELIVADFVLGFGKVIA